MRTFDTSVCRYMIAVAMIRANRKSKSRYNQGRDMD